MSDIVPKKNLDLAALDDATQEVAQQILEETDVSRIKDLTTLFNLNTQKRNVYRVMKMTSLLDRVTDRIEDRFEKFPENFSNEDLIKYMQIIESSIEKSNKTLGLVDETPPIQLLQQNNVNLNLSEIDRDGRERVADAVKAILQRLSLTEESVDNIQKEEDDNKNES